MSSSPVNSSGALDEKMEFKGHGYATLIVLIVIVTLRLICLVSNTHYAGSKG